MTILTKAIFVALVLLSAVAAPAAYAKTFLPVGVAMHYASDAGATKTAIWAGDTREGTPMDMATCKANYVAIARMHRRYMASLKEYAGMHFVSAECLPQNLWPATK